MHIYAQNYYVEITFPSPLVHKLKFYRDESFARVIEQFLGYYLISLPMEIRLSIGS